MQSTAERETRVWGKNLSKVQGNREDVKLREHLEKSFDKPCPTLYPKQHYGGLKPLVVPRVIIAIRKPKLISTFD